MHPDFMTEFARIAQQTPSVPLDLGLEYHPELDPPIWVACATLYLNIDEQPSIAEGNGATAGEALEDLLTALIRL